MTETTVVEGAHTPSGSFAAKAKKKPLGRPRKGTSDDGVSLGSPPSTDTTTDPVNTLAMEVDASLVQLVGGGERPKRPRAKKDKVVHDIIMQ